MIASSLVHAARTAPDARRHIHRMARHMVRMKNADGACTVVHLFQAGFTEAQVAAYRDPARAMIQGLPELGLTTSPPGRREAEAAVEAIREIRVIRLGARMFGPEAVRPAAPEQPAAPERSVWAPPVVRELNNLELTL